MSKGDSTELDDKKWSKKMAEIVVEALTDAQLLSVDQHFKALDLTANEIHIRLIIGDRPLDKSHTSE